MEALFERGGAYGGLCACARRRTQFSTITTAPSTMIPKSRAPRLMGLALTFWLTMPLVNNIDKGITMAVIRARAGFPKQEKYGDDEHGAFQQVLLDGGDGNQGWCGRRRSAWMPLGQGLVDLRHLLVNRLGRRSDCSRSA